MAGPSRRSYGAEVPRLAAVVLPGRISDTSDDDVCSPSFSPDV